MSVASTTVEIHGDTWQVEHIREDVESCRQHHDWQHAAWFPGRHAAASPTSQLRDHDHCQVCWWTLALSEDPRISTGWTRGGRVWLCCECYERFIANDGLRCAV